MCNHSVLLNCPRAPLHCNQFRVDMKFIPVFCFAIISFHAETKQLNGKTNEIQSEIQRSERNLQVLSHLTSLESQVTCNTITKQSKHHNLSWERLMTEKRTAKKHLMTRVMRLRAARAACTRRTATSRATGVAWSATARSAAPPVTAICPGTGKSGAADLPRRRCINVYRCIDV